jgi:hypothetical protein
MDGHSDCFEIGMSLGQLRLENRQLRRSPVELFRAGRVLSLGACPLFGQRLSVGLALLLSLGDGLAECGEFGLIGGQPCLRGCEVGGLLFELFRARRLLRGVACLLLCQRLSVGLALLSSLGDALANCGEFGLVGGQLCLRGCEVGGL